MPSQPVIRQRRATCWWEPTYDPSLVGVMTPGSWDFSHNIGPTKCQFEGTALATHLGTGGDRVIRGVTFTDCDFQGYFKHSAQLVFDRCNFYNCDLGLTTWTNVKFSNCTFDRVSIGQTRFENCEFRSCAWEKIGLSPNGLEFHSTYFSNTSDFISAAYTNLDASVLALNSASGRDQKLRLESTKATISRRILKMLQAEGDEIAFYDAVRTFQIQHAISRQALAIQRFHDSTEGYLSRASAPLSIAGWFAEQYILISFGWINNWGASVTKPATISVINFVSFALIYEFICHSTVSASAWQRSFDISILAGYTNYGKELDHVTILFQNINLMIAVILYSLTFATIVNRLSRVR